MSYGSYRPNTAENEMILRITTVPGILVEKLCQAAYNTLETFRKRKSLRKVCMPDNKGVTETVAPVASQQAQQQTSGWKDTLQLVFNQGGPGFSHFAITNLCDAHCGFCGFAVGKLKASDMKSVSLQDGLDCIDILYRNGIRYLIFVGGEPLLHKDLLTFIAHARAKGMTPLVSTNGSHLTPELIHRMKDAGLASVIISVDAPSVALHEKNRGLSGLCDKIAAANRVLNEIKLQTTASVTVSKLITYDDYDLLPAFLKSLGFEEVTFSYPLEYLKSSYLSFSENGLVHFTADELVTIFEKLKTLKSKIAVLNNTISLGEMQKFLLGKPQHFGCLGGYRYFYVDWNLDVYRCHYWSQPMCKISEFGPDKLIRDNCQLCMIDCYRDPSVLQHIAVSLTDANHFWQAGKYRQALGAIFRKTNYWSLKAVIEQMNWIRKM